MKHRFNSLAAIVMLALSLILAAPVAAQEELPEGVSLEFIAFAMAGEIPESHDQLILFRMTLAPGAAFPITPEQGTVSLAEVERGVLTTTVDGPVQVARAGAEPFVEETMPGGESFTLEAGDSGLYPAALSGEVRNDGAEEVSLLILEAVAPMEMSAASTPGASESEGLILGEGVTAELLAAGAFPDLPGGAILSLSRVTYEPGVSQPGTPQPGAEVAVVEAGAFTLEVTDGPPLTILRAFGETVAAGAEPAVEMAAPGQTIEVAAGDATFFPTGNVAGVSNAGAADAVALLGIVLPAEMME